MEHRAVNVAVGTFGAANDRAVELARLYFVTHDSCRAVFNDTRRNQVSGPYFWCDINLTPSSTQETVRDYVISRIERYFSEYPKPGCGPIRPGAGVGDSVGTRQDERCVPLAEREH